MLSVQGAIGADLVERLSAASLTASPEYLDVARTVLERLLSRPECLVGRKLERRAGGFARTLLFGDERLSLFALVWDVGAITPIHDHHCSCCYAVLSGTLTESEFRAVSDTAAIMTAQAERGAGHVACMLPTGPNLHQVINRGASEAISLHIYGYDHRAHGSSVDRQYVLAAQ